MSSVLEFYSDRLERLQCERGFIEEGLFRGARFHVQLLQVRQHLPSS